MANLSNINNKFIVTDGNNGRVLIGATNDIGATLFANHPSTTAPSLTFNAPAGQVFENEDLQIAFGLNNASPYNGYMQTRFVSAPYYRNLAINPLGGNVGIGTNSPGRELEVVGVIKADGTFISTASSSNTNLSTANGGQLSLFNSNSTDGNFSNVGGYNSNSLVTSQINFVNDSHTSRTGFIAFMTHNGSTMPERMRIDSSGNVKIGNSTTGTPAANADDLVIDKGASESGITLISTAAASIRFGDAANTSIGSVEYNHNSNYMRFSTNNAERIRIDSSGDVGIGTIPETAGPTWRTLFVGASATIVSRQAAAGYDSMFANNYYVNSSNQDRVRTTGPSSRMFLDGNNIRFQISPSTGAGGSPTWSEIMRIDDSGNVGIGTDSPSALLEIQTAGTSGLKDFQIFSRGESPNYEVFKISRSAGSTELLANQNLTLSADYDANHTSVDSNIIFKTDNTEKMRIDSSGNVTIGSSTLTGSRSLTLLSATNATNYDINFQQAGTTNFGRIRFTEGAADFQFFAQVGQDPNLTLQYGGNSFFSRGNVGIGTTTPDALLSTADTNSYTQEWKYAKGYRHFTTYPAGYTGNYNISTKISLNNLRGLCVDYYESGHLYNNGAAYYFRHTKFYIMMEGTTLRINDAVLIKSTGNRTDAIVNAPAVTTNASLECLITSTIKSGFTHYVSADMVGSGFNKIKSIS